jgi:hypothetical protein
MSRYLLDVSVLIALHDPTHVHHEAAHKWFQTHRRDGWATCPMTINGCARIMSNPNYKAVDATAHEILQRLRVLCTSPEHEFWPHSLAMFDARHFRTELVNGSAQVQDIYLVATALAHRGKLATVDRRIPWKAVVGATVATITLI